MPMPMVLDRIVRSPWQERRDFGPLVAELSLFCNQDAFLLDREGLMFDTGIELMHPS